MKRSFYSLIGDTAPGFEKVSLLGKRELLDGAVALLSQTLEESLHLFGEYADRVCGVIITVGEELRQEKVRTMLWHLSIPRRLLQDLHAMTNALIDHIESEQTIMNSKLELELNLRRSQELHQRTLKAHNDNVDRLIRRASEINRLLDQSLIGSFRSDASGELIRANPALLKMLGFESVNDLNRHGGVKARYVNPKDRSTLIDLTKSAPVRSFETQLLQKNGNIIDVILSVYSVLGEGENVDFVEGNLIDNTAHKHAIQELKNSKSTLEAERRLFELGPVMVFKWRNEENWPVEYVSPNVEEVLGYTREDFLSHRVIYGNLIHPDEIATVTEEVNHGTKDASGAFAHFPYRIRNAKDEYLWVDDYTTVLRNDEGEVTHFLGYVVNINKRKLAELEKSSLERQLQHAQKLESLGVLAGGIAHDFNNLLMAILGNADLARQKVGADSQARSMLNEIVNASRRAADLAKQMLDYSGKGRFVVQPIDLGYLIQEMSHLLEVSISKNAKMTFNLAKSLPNIEGDATQIRQVIMNLLTNASEAIGNTQGVIAIETGSLVCSQADLDGADRAFAGQREKPLQPGPYVYLEIRDSGCGMSADTIARIFDPFFTTKFAGRGLGMSAVLGIIRGHGGTMKITSKIGHGTTFRILFPAVEESENQESQESHASSNPTLWTGHGVILVVDDEEPIRKVVGGMLQAIGFDVVYAEHGHQALEVIESGERSFECVLLDLTMPVMGGEETHRRIKKVRPDLRVVLCSGYNESDATQKFCGKGLAGFIQKPYTINKLRDVLNRAIEA